MIPPLRVLSAGSTLYGVRPCAAEFARQTGIATEVATDHGHNIEAAVLRGDAVADVVLLPLHMISALVAAEAAAPEVVSLGRVPIGMAMRAGTQPPDIATMAGWQAALLAAPAVLLTRAPTGEHLQSVLVRLGLAAALAHRITLFDTATLLNQHLARRADAAIGFAPTTEILAWRDKGIALAGLVPDEIQVVLAYGAARLTRTPVQEAAQRFLNYLAQDAARASFRATGVI